MRLERFNEGAKSRVSMSSYFIHIPSLNSHIAISAKSSLLAASKVSTTSVFVRKHSIDSVYSGDISLNILSWSFTDADSNTTLSTIKRVLVSGMCYTTFLNNFLNCTIIISTRWSFTVIELSLFIVLGTSSTCLSFLDWDVNHWVRQLEVSRNFCESEHNDRAKNSQISISFQEKIPLTAKWYRWLAPPTKCLSAKKEGLCVVAKLQENMTITFSNVSLKSGKNVLQRV